MSQRTTIEVVAATKSSGDPVFEELLVDFLGDDEFLIVATPAILLGYAAGDRIRFTRSNATVQLIERGRNVSILVYGAHGLADKLMGAVAGAGGSLDSRAPNLTVFTLPVELGFEAIELIFNDFVERHSGTSWYYGNVYGDDGVTPLNWWLE